MRGICCGHGHPPGAREIPAMYGKSTSNGRHNGKAQRLRFSIYSCVTLKNPRVALIEGKASGGGSHGWQPMAR